MKSKPLPLEGRTPWVTYAQVLLDRSGCQIKRYSAGMGGCAYHGPGWWIKVPRPRCPESFSVFAHEVGHHMKGHALVPNAKVRYIEEQEAWLYALEVHREFGLPRYDEIAQKACRAMGYAFGKRARRLRGEVTAERFPGVDPLFQEMLDRTLAAGPERRFWWQHAGKDIVIPKADVAAQSIPDDQPLMLVIGNGRPRIVAKRRR